MFVAVYDSNYYAGNGQQGDRIALRWYTELLYRAGAEPPILDFGSGTGHLLRRLVKRFGAADGIEPSSHARTTSRGVSPTSTVFSAVQQLPTVAGVYGGATAIHVLEHLPPEDLHKTLSAIAAALVPGSPLLVVTPDASGRASRLRGETWRALEDPTHINLQGHNYWREQLQSAGFSLVQEGTEGMWDPPYSGWLVDRINLVPVAMQVVTSRLFLGVGKGESSVIIART